MTTIEEPLWLTKPSVANVQLLNNDVFDSLERIEAARSSSSDNEISQNLNEMRKLLEKTKQEIESFSIHYHQTFFQYIDIFFLNPPKDAEELKKRTTEGHENDTTCETCGSRVWFFNRHTCRCCKATLCSWNGCAGSRPFNHINKHPSFEKHNFDVILCEACACNSYESAYTNMTRLAKIIRHVNKYCKVVEELGTAITNSSGVEEKQKELEYALTLFNSDKEFEYFEAESDFGNSPTKIK
jgi:hypothetical protein